ncbi:MAG: muramoyltetrapeptide carboxypeptidase [Candidatus Micrarchaeota archaeon]|nr:MAG: muramoyltetrapeptide carboxypeptidase [Candidatus Micrarchaeota archaeon]
MLKGIDYTIEYFNRCLAQDKPFNIIPAEEWSDDEWYIDQERCNFIKNNGFLLIHEGEAEGKIVGGNLSTLSLLQGTEYMPSLKDSILFIEDDEGVSPRVFDR